MIRPIADMVAAERAAGLAMEELLRVLARLAFGAGPDDAAGTALPPEARARLVQAVWRLQAGLEDLRTHVPPEQLGRALAGLDYVATSLRRELFAWLRIVDAVVEEAEQSYGSEGKRGRYKKQIVRAALLYQVRRAQIQVPGLPEAVTPFVASAAADVLIDFVVIQIDSNDLWTESARQRTGPETLGRRLGAPTVDRTSTLLGWLGAKLVRLSWWLVTRPGRLPERVRRVVDRADPDLRATADAAAALVQLVAHYRPVIVALVEMLSIATQQAEVFAELTGAQKKLFARELVLAALAQNGVVPAGGPVRRMVETLLDVAIDLSIEIYNRRGFYGHAASARPSGLAAAQ